MDRPTTDERMGQSPILHPFESPEAGTAGVGAYLEESDRAERDRREFESPIEGGQAGHGRSIRTHPYETDPTYRGSRFADVWRTLLSDRYEELPEKLLGLTSIPEMISKGIYAAARRTLTSRADLLAPFDKLVHGLGICLRGTWSIDVATPYSGLFASHRRGLIIARASDAVGEHRPGKLRFLGLAGKLYATRDPDHAEPLPTANFFTLENLSGTHTRHFLDAVLPTDLWRMRPRAEAAAEAPVGAVVAAAFALADRAWNPAQPMIRQLYPIAELGESDRNGVTGPVVMQLVPWTGNRRVDAADLREELHMAHHPHGIRYSIEVADRRWTRSAKEFRRIGHIHFVESVVSWSGDHRLHFAHPPYRPSWPARQETRRSRSS